MKNSINNFEKKKTTVAKYFHHIPDRFQIKYLMKPPTLHLLATNTLKLLVSKVNVDRQPQITTVESNDVAMYACDTFRMESIATLTTHDATFTSWTLT